jgi:multiple sugar transport system permease protein
MKKRPLFVGNLERYRSPKFWRDTAQAYLYLLPALVILGTFTFYPFIKAFWISFYHWKFRNSVFVGWENYIKIFHDDLFWLSLWHTVYYALGNVIPTMTLAMFIAVLLNSKIKGRSFFRTAFFLPYVTNTVAASMVFLWIYDRDYGLLNYFLHTLFHIRLIDWLNTPQFAMPAVILMGIWRFLGFDVVIFLAGLQNIDKMYYEAAEVDGATGWKKFRYITLPLLSPTTFFVFIISIIGAFKVFQEIYILWSGPGGGPLHSAMTVMIYFYNTAWGQWHLGRGAAVANILFVIIFIITLIQMRLSKRWVFYQ